MRTREYAGIDYDWRPVSYWSETNPLQAILRNVKGRVRRKLIIDSWNAGKMEDLDSTMLKDSLEEGERDAFGAIHPFFMGGEYLPDFLSLEVGIAEIELQSTTGDVMSVRARPIGADRISYRAVDEYPDDWELVCSPKVSNKPLSLRELIELLETGDQVPDGLVGGFLLGYNNGCAEDDRPCYRSFTTIWSAIYEQLADHCEHVFDDWAAGRTDEEGRMVKSG